MSKTTMLSYGESFFLLLTFLAAAPFELGDVATLIHPDAKKYLIVVGAVATAILKVWKGHVTADKAPAEGNQV
jgi:hypothetical protein